MVTFTAARRAPGQQAIRGHRRRRLRCPPDHPLRGRQSDHSIAGEGPVDVDGAVWMPPRIDHDTCPDGHLTCHLALDEKRRLMHVRIHNLAVQTSGRAASRHRCHGTLLAGVPSPVPVHVIRPGVGACPASRIRIEGAREVGARVQPEISVLQLDDGFAVTGDIAADAQARAPIVERDHGINRVEPLAGRSLLFRQARLVATQAQAQR